MMAVRVALSRPKRLAEVMAELLERGQVDPSELDDLEEPLNFVVHEGGAVSIPDAAYRFVRYEPGVDVVLSGTGSESHLQANLASFARPPLPQADVERLKHIFRRVDSVSGQ
jgi:aryl-alcohol dehydrogenase-like predicted oxidoreductase